MASASKANLEEAFRNVGADVPKGMVHILHHVGSTRQDVYRSMWSSLIYVGKLSTSGKRTLVYPKVVREVVRERFGGEETGKYDSQYEEEGKAYHVTIEDMSEVEWRKPPKACKLCNN
ncbi:uncharacterized protein [Littorina saxatilis]|uniref:uncharacterized protein n=1 Tax=Littorina saxatilis TaxID=31220 RepID=UPI0038B54ADA